MRSMNAATPHSLNTSIVPFLNSRYIFAGCCYGELRFGPHPLKSSAGVQQGDPLGPLLFSLVVLDQLETSEPLTFSVWYLDNGTLIPSFLKLSSLALLSAFISITRSANSFSLLVINPFQSFLLSYDKSHLPMRVWICLAPLSWV